MPMMLILILIESLIIIENLKLFHQDILSPATVSSITFLIATILAFCCINIWDIELCETTIIVITLGLMTMTLGEFIGRKIKLNMSVSIYPKSQGLKLIYIKPYTKILFVLTILILTILYAINAYQVGMKAGGSGLNAFAYMKQAHISGRYDLHMNMFIRQGYKVVASGSYIACYIYVNNKLLLKDKKSSNIEYLFIILCGCTITIFAGSRTDILRIISAFLFDYIILWKICYKNKQKEITKSSRKILEKAIPLAVFLAFIAYCSRAIVKVENVSTSATNSLLYYVAYYIGSPIAVLNTKIKMAFANGGLLFGTNITVPNHVYLGELNYGGNVGTNLQTTLMKHGLIYMLIWILLIYTVGGMLYKKMTRMANNSYRNSLSIVLFSSWYYVFTMSYYSDIMSEMGFIKTNILTNVVQIILYYCLFKTKIGYR